MKKLPTEKESLSYFFGYFPYLFDGEKYPDFRATCQFIFTDIDGGWPVCVRFADGKATVHEGELADGADVTVRTTSAVWLGVTGGRRSGFFATLTRRLKVEGDKSLLRRMPKLLSRKVAVPKAPAPPKVWTPPKSVLAVNASPRKQEGMTYFFLKPFLEGMEEAGAAITDISLYDYKIKNCLGCFSCWTKTPGACVIKDDDQTRLIEMTEAADLIVYAVPLYSSTVPGLLKTHFDRMIVRVHPYMEEAPGGLTRHPRRSGRIQHMALLSVCGFPEKEHFRALVPEFEARAVNASMPLVAKVLVPGAMHRYNTPMERESLLETLSLIKEAGRQVVLRGKADKRIIRKIMGPKVKIEEWRAGANMYWDKEIKKNL